MFLQINDIDRNIYMIASIVKDGNKLTYKMINGTQLQETFDTEEEAESKYEEAIESTGGGGGNIPLDPDGKIPAEYLPSYVDDVIDLLTIADTAPSSCAKGDKYYNTTEKKIFIASATDTWGSTGKTPEKDKIYVNTADDPATSWRWSGTDLVLIGGGAIVDVTRTEYLLPEDIYGSTFPVFLYRYSMVLNIGSTWDISSAGQLDSIGSNTLDILPKMVMYCLNDLLSSINRESYSYIGFNIDLFNYNYDQFLTLELRTSDFKNTGTPANVYGFAIKKQDKKENVYTTYTLNLTYNNDGVITRVVFKNKSMQEPTLIPTDNIIAYTPTQDYHPATKKYVDDNMSNIQYSTLPTASAELENEIAQYVGATENGYTKGYFYVCNAQGTDPETYAWEQINVQPQGSSPSPDLPTNGVRLLKKAANSVQALGLIDNPTVDDACLVLTDEVIEYPSFVEIDPFGVIDIGEGTTVKFPKPTSFKFTGDVSNLKPMPDYSISIFSDVKFDDPERQATEWFGFNLAGPNPSDNSSWYMFEFIAGSSSSASELRASTGIVNAWVCADPSVDPTFVYIDDANAVATLVDSFGFDVYNYGMEEYTTHATMKYFADQVSIDTQGEHSFREFIPLNFEKEVITTETYKKSDLYTYNGSEWVYRDRNLSANANWDENDPTAPGYVRGRTHYVIPGSGTGKSITIDTSDSKYAFEIKENSSMYNTTFYDCYSADITEANAEPYIDILNILDEFYQLGFVGKEKPLRFTYGSVVRDVYLTKEEDPEGTYTGYVIHNIEAVIPEQGQEGEPENVEIEIYIGKNTPQGQNVNYGATVSILSSIYEEQGKLTTFTLSGGVPEQVVKLDEKFIPQLADWNESDSTSPKYIANRTHYKEGSTGTLENLGSESFSDFERNSYKTPEGVQAYGCNMSFKLNLEDQSETQGNEEAKRLFDEFERIYNKYNKDVIVTVKVGSLAVSGKLLYGIKEIDSFNRSEIFAVATDGGELDMENPLGTVEDKFNNNSKESKGILLVVTRIFHEDQE